MTGSLRGRRRALLAALVLLVAPAWAAEAQAQDTTATPPAAYPVRLGFDTLFMLNQRLGAFTAQERAQAIEARLGRLMAGPAVPVTVVPGESADELMAGDMIVMAVTDADAEAAGETRPEMAARLAGLLTDRLARASDAATARVLLFGLLYTGLTTVGFAFLVWLLLRGFRRLDEVISGERLPAFRVQRLVLLSPAQMAAVLSAALAAGRVVVFLVVGYLYLSVVLGFFPQTRHLATTILHYALTPLAAMGTAIAGYLPKALVIVVTLVVTRIVLKLVRLVFLAIERGTVHFPGFDAEWAQPTYKIVRFLVFAFVAIILFPYLPGAESSAFKGVSLFLGALFTLGSSSAIANVVAGTVLTYTRAFKVGDRIRIGETEGDVIARSLLVTRIRTPKNVDITIPNAQVLGGHIQNYSAMAADEGLILHTSVTIGYDAPWRQVHELLVAAARDTKGLLPEPIPFVLQTSLNDFYVSYQINAYTRDPSRMPRLYSDLHQNIQDRFAQAGVEIMSPHYRAVREGPSTIPPAPKGTAS